MSWFTSHRPRSIAELHLSSVRKQLEALRTAATFPQALLFAGPKGVGKTSSARIIGALLNDPANAEMVDYLFFDGEKPKQARLEEPNPEDPLVARIEQGSSYVVHELDAASNRGIDDIRALKERLGLPPQEGKISVYILDEVHMLTTEAFNALLKVLEEPPAHVVFVLATTELHKIPETIVSRCVTVSFRQATADELHAVIKQVAAAEEVSIEDEAVEMIGQAAYGSFRDAIKLLEQAAQSAGDGIAASDVAVLIGGNVLGPTKDLIHSILEKDPVAVSEVFSDLRAQQVDSVYFHRSFISYMHQQLVAGLHQEDAIAAPKIIQFLLQAFQTVPLSTVEPVPLLGLELQALDIVFRAQDQASGGSSPKKASSGSSQNKKKVKVVAESQPVIQTSQPVVPPVEDVPESEARVAEALTSEPGDALLLKTQWAAFMEHVGEDNMSLELLLRSARPGAADGSRLDLEVFYSFHQEQLKNSKFYAHLQEAAMAVAGGAIEFNILVVSPSPQSAADEEVVVNVGPVVDNQLEQLAKQVLV